MSVKNSTLRKLILIHSFFESILDCLWNAVCTFISIKSTSRHIFIGFDFKICGYFKISSDEIYFSESHINKHVCTETDISSDQIIISIY